MLSGGNPQESFLAGLQLSIKNAQDILDIGTPQRFHKELRPYESLFQGKSYLAVGYMPEMKFNEYNCDGHQDIQSMTFEDSSFDAVLCIEVLEHVMDPVAASRELYRVLRTNGRLLLTVPFLTQYHGKRAEVYTPSHISYPDYWRFTHQGLELLLRDFRSIEILPLGGPIEFRLKQFYMEPLLSKPLFRKLVDFIDKPQLGKATTRHMALAIK
jgi:SAM-dependent methyltransferase